MYLEEICCGFEVGLCGVIFEDCFMCCVVDVDFIDCLYEGLMFTS